MRDYCSIVGEREGDLDLLSCAYLIGGLILHRDGKLFKAVEALEEALRLSKESKGLHKSTILSNLSAAFLSVGEIELALDHGHKAVENLYKEIMGKSDRRFDRETLHIKVHTINQNREMSIANYNIGRAIKETGNLPEAQKFFKRGLMGLERMGEVNSEIYLKITEEMQNMKKELLCPKPGLLPSSKSIDPKFHKSPYIGKKTSHTAKFVSSTGVFSEVIMDHQSCLQDKHLMK